MLKTGIYFSTSAVAAATWDSGCGVGGPVLTNWLSVSVLRTRIYLDFKPQKKSTKKTSALNKPPVFHEELTDVMYLLIRIVILWINWTKYHLFALVNEFLCIESRNTLIGVFFIYI